MTNATKIELLKVVSQALKDEHCEQFDIRKWKTMRAINRAIDMIECIEAGYNFD